MELAAVFAAHWGRFASTHRHLLTGAHDRAAEAALGGQVHLRVESFRCGHCCEGS